MTKDKWKSVKGFEDYIISESGVVIRAVASVGKGASNTYVGKEIKSHPHPKFGHRYIVLRKNKKFHSCKVHRLVALTFIGDQPEGKNCVAHWDGDTSNNHVSNLRWASHKENAADKYRHGTWDATVKKTRHLTKEQAIEIFLSKERGFILAKKYKTNQNTICNIRKGKIYKCFTSGYQIKD